MPKSLPKKRPNHAITMKKRWGPDIFKKLGAKSKGGGFNDKEVASRAGKKGRQKQLEQKQKEKAENESRSSTDPEEGDTPLPDHDS